MVTILHEPDDAVERLAAALKVYEQSHEAAACFVYRYNPAAIRVKIIDPTFHGRSKGERHDYVWEFLQGVPEDILAQISVLLCLEPGESAPLDVEFHEPTRSYL
jgi:hypothetical protein